jgi:hypothetical protein
VFKFLLAAVTLGFANPAVTQQNIDSTICVPGWTKIVRPSSAYTNRLKHQQMLERGLPGSARDYEENHIIPLELGGHPSDPRNLEPELLTGKYGARAHDKIENELKRRVCHGQMSLAQARIDIVSDWHKYVRN